MEKNKKLPKGWEISKIVDLTLSRKLGIDRSRIKQFDYGTPYLKMNNITFGGSLELSLIKYIQCTEKEKKEHLLEYGDIVFNTRNSFELVGKTAFWNNAIPECVYNNNIMRIKVCDAILPKFLVYFMNSHGFRNSLLSIKKATTNICAIYDKDLKEQLICLPPLNEQQRILEKIETLFLLIDLSKQVLEKTKILLKQYRQSLLQWAFDIVKIENEKEIINKERNLCELKSVADVIDPHPSHRAPPKVSNGFPFAGIGDVKENGEIDVKHTRKIHESFLLHQEQSYEINSNSIGYGRVGTVGKVVKLRKQEFRYALSPTMAVINPKKTINPLFLFYQLKSNFFFKQVSQNITGTTRSAIGILKLRKILVNVPSLDEQKIIVEKIEKSFLLIEKDEKFVNLLLLRLDSIKNSILTQAFEGKLVLQDPNDEPASELLKRIKN